MIAYRVQLSESLQTPAFVLAPQTCSGVELFKMMALDQELDHTAITRALLHGSALDGREFASGILNVP